MNKFGFSAFIGIICAISAFLMVTFYDYQYVPIVFFFVFLLSLIILLYLYSDFIRDYKSVTAEWVISLLDSRRKIILFPISVLFIFISICFFFNRMENNELLREDAKKLSIYAEEYIKNQFFKYEEDLDKILYLVRDKEKDLVDSLKIVDHNRFYNLMHINGKKREYLYSDIVITPDIKFFRSVLNENSKAVFIEISPKRVLMHLISFWHDKSAKEHYLDVIYDFTPELFMLKRVFHSDFIIISNEGFSIWKSFLTFDIHPGENYLNRFKNSEKKVMLIESNNRRYLGSKVSFSPSGLISPVKIYALKSIGKKIFWLRYFFVESVVAFLICFLVVIFLYNFTHKMNEIVSDALFERDELKADLNAKSLFFNSIMDNLDFGIIITDPDGFIIYSNPVSTGLANLRTGSESNIKDIIQFSLNTIKGHFSQDEIFDKLISSSKSHCDGVLKSEYGDTKKVFIKTLMINGNQEDFHGLVFIVKESPLLENYGEKFSSPCEQAVCVTGIGFWKWDIKNNSCFFSRSWKSLVGYNGEDMDSRIDYLFSLIHRDDKEETLMKLYEHINGETEFYENQYRILKQDGDYGFIWDRGRVTRRDENGNGMEILCTSIDISKYSDIKDLVRTKNILFDKGPVIYFKWAYQKGLPVLCVSNNVKDILGYSPEEFMERSVLYSDIMFGDGYPVLWEKMQDAYHNGISYFVSRFKLETRDGELMEMIHNIYFVGTPKGEMEFVVGYIISESPDLES